MRQITKWPWHPDEVFVKKNGGTHYISHAVEHEGDVLESYVTKPRDKSAELRFLEKAMNRCGALRIVVTEGLKSYRAAMKDIGNIGRQEIGRHLNYRVENSHLPLRRRERLMLGFRRMSTLQKFASTHALFDNHYNLGRHLNRRQTFKPECDAALTE